MRTLKIYFEARYIILCVRASSYYWKFVPFDKHLPIFPSPEHLTTTILLSMYLAFLDCTCIYDCPVFVFQCLTHFT
jgi:hypothetical protein